LARASLADERQTKKANLRAMPSQRSRTRILPGLADVSVVFVETSDHTRNLQERRGYLRLNCGNGDTVPLQPFGTEQGAGLFPLSDFHKCLHYEELKPV
jgi:hypothetical protein